MCVCVCVYSTALALLLLYYIIIKYIIFDRGTCPEQRFPRAPMSLLYDAIVYFFGHVRNRSYPVRTARVPPPFASLRGVCVCAVNTPRRRPPKCQKAYTARYQSVLRCRTRTMTTLRTVVGVCREYVKVSAALYLIRCCLLGIFFDLYSEALAGINPSIISLYFFRVFRRESGGVLNK